MLGKLLKYDLKYTFKYWWILALSSFGLSVIGGICLSIIDGIEGNEPMGAFLILFAIVGILLTILGISAFLIISQIFVYGRFYKNFFSDEGYLTFTLPVKRQSLLASKLLMSFIINICTVTLIIIDVFTIFIVGLKEDFFSPAAWKYLFGLAMDFFDTFGAYGIICIIEAFAMLLLSSLFSTLVVFVCITFASMITKKNKVFAAIGIYYLVNTSISFAAQIAFTFGIVGLSSWLADIPASALPPIITLMLLALTAFFAAATVLIYLLELWMTDKKLNLA